jgi:tRNA(Ile)-lysidine synthase
MADVRRALRQWGERWPNDLAPLHLVALSGGGDSLALAWAAGIELPKLGHRVGAVIVDHQLQPESARVAQNAAELAKGWGLSPVLVKTVSVGQTGGPEEAARNARYQAFNEAMGETGAVGVLLAHSQDDQAETVVLGLARGSGPASLKGMSPQDGAYSRPLLSLPRATLRQALDDAGVDWWEDPHNTDERFSRVRVRTTVLPVLEKEIGPGIAGALSRTAELFRQDSDALDGMATTILERFVTQGTDGSLVVDVSVLEEQPVAISSRVLRMMVVGVGAQAPSYPQMTQIMSLVSSWRGQSAVALAGANVERKDGALRVWQAREESSA